MSYRHIDNLYVNQAVLIFKTVFALEKIHGTSAHLSWKNKTIHFFAGGSKHNNFVALFDQVALTTKFMEFFPDSDITIYGEAFGGKLQNMSHTYGPNLKFVAFEVMFKADGRERWYNVPDAERIVRLLGLDFVSYELCTTDLLELDRQRDLPSEEAFKAGMAIREKPETWKQREGIVIRPPVELYDFNGGRFLAKHKHAKFSERQNQPNVGENAILITEAKAIADEWVVRERLLHVIDRVKVENGVEEVNDPKQIPLLIKTMIEDVGREAANEIVMSKQVEKQIGNKTALLFKEWLQEKLQETV